MERDADILEKAAELLEENGWCQHNRRLDHSGAMCLRGALMMVTMGTARGLPMHPALLRVEAELSRELGRPGSDTAHIIWNDAPGRTKEDVTNLLRRVAQKLRQQPDPSRGEGG